jgi:putative ABC transport system permease protein
METLRRDLLGALRGWRRNPAPVLAAAGALTLAIAANTTIFSAVSGVLLTPLPYAAPDRLVMVWQDLRARGGPERDWASPGLLVEWLARNDVFAHLAAIQGWNPNLTEQDEPERLRGAMVSPAYFDALGVPARVGRTFAPAEGTPGGPLVAIISHSLWVRRFGGDPNVVGRPIVLDGASTEIVGVMPESFRAAVIDAEIFAPLRINPANAPRGLVTLRVLGSIKPELTLSAAQAGMTALALQLERDDPEWERARTRLVPLHEDMVGTVRPILALLTGAVVLVLMIACANVASLLLATASERMREMAIRVALGAARGRLVRQLLTESFALAAVAAAAGVALAYWGLQGLLAIAPPGAPRLQDVELDGVVLLFTASISMIAALLAGIAPALSIARAELTPALREGARESTAGTRVRALLVIAEVALAMVLAVGSGLLLRSLAALQQVDLGFDPAHVLTASVNPPRIAYRTPESMRQLYTNILETLSASPLVRAAAITSILPLSGADMNLDFEIEGREPPRTPGDAPMTWFRIVSPSYFAAMAIPVVQGRALSDSDRADTDGAFVVNESLARRYWSDRSPVGQRVRVNGVQGSIVGVVKDVHHRGPSTPPQQEMYVSYLQGNPRAASIVVRGTSDPAALTATLRDAVRRADARLPIAQVAPLQQLVERSVAQPRFLAALLTGFSVLASLLAVVGVYGMLSFSVARRVREIGVRMALGAQPRTVLALVLRDSVVTVGAGLLLGAMAAIGLARFLTSLLFGVRPGDPATIVVTGSALLAAALLASYAPARRAATVDPLEALRTD